MSVTKVNQQLNRFHMHGGHLIDTKATDDLTKVKTNSAQFTLEVEVYDINKSSSDISTASLESGFVADVPSVNSSRKYVNSSCSSDISSSSHDSIDNTAIVNSKYSINQNGFSNQTSSRSGSLDEYLKSFNQPDSISLSIDNILEFLDKELVKAESGLDDEWWQTDDGELSRSLISLISLNNEFLSEPSETINQTLPQIPQLPPIPLQPVPQTRKLKPRSDHVEKPVKKSEFLRKVERFGSDLKDTCLFPLALPMDGSDIYKGTSSWESLMLLSDCVLTIWQDRSPSSNQSLCKKKALNSTLPNSTQYLCLYPKLSDKAFLYPDVHLPFRKCCSLIDLSNLENEKNEVIQPTEKETVKLDEDSSQTHKRNLKSKALDLMANKKIEETKRFANYLTKLEKEYYLAIEWREFMYLIFKKGPRECKNLRMMLQFSQEVSQLIVDLIEEPSTTETCAKVIANAIEVAFILQQRRNFQSFESVMRGLHHPKVYRKAPSWKLLAKCNPLHLNVFVYLSTLLAYKANKSLSYQINGSLPNLASFVEILRMQALSVWDRLESKSKWKYHSDIVEWMSQYEFDDNLIGKEIEEKIHKEIDIKMQKMKQKYRPRVALKKICEFKSHNLTKLFRKDRNSIGKGSMSMLKCSLGTCLQVNQLPDTWRLCSLRRIPSTNQMFVIKEFYSIYRSVIQQIDLYKF